MRASAALMHWCVCLFGARPAALHTVVGVLQTQHHTLQQTTTYGTAQWNAVRLCLTTRRDATRRDATRCDATRRDAMRCDAMRCDSVRFGSVRCDAHQDKTRQSTTIPYNTTYTQDMTRHYQSTQCMAMHGDAIRHNEVQDHSARRAVIVATAELGSCSWRDVREKRRRMPQCEVVVISLSLSIYIYICIYVYIDYMIYDI